jgi:hypothetical protein
LGGQVSTMPPPLRTPRRRRSLLQSAPCACVRPYACARTSSNLCCPSRSAPMPLTSPYPYPHAPQPACMRPAHPAYAAAPPALHDCPSRRPQPFTVVAWPPGCTAAASRPRSGTPVAASRGLHPASLSRCPGEPPSLTAPPNANHHAPAPPTQRSRRTQSARPAAGRPPRPLPSLPPTPPLPPSPRAALEPAP